MTLITMLQCNNSEKRDSEDPYLEATNCKSEEHHKVPHPGPDNSFTNVETMGAPTHQHRLAKIYLQKLLFFYVNFIDRGAMVKKSKY